MSEHARSDLKDCTSSSTAPHGGLDFRAVQVELFRRPPSDSLEDRPDPLPSRDASRRHGPVSGSGVVARASQASGSVSQTRGEADERMPAQVGVEAPRGGLRSFGPCS